MYYFTGHTYPSNRRKIARNKRLLYFPSLVRSSGRRETRVGPRGPKTTVSGFKNWSQGPASERGSEKRFKKRCKHLIECLKLRCALLPIEDLWLRRSKENVHKIGYEEKSMKKFVFLAYGYEKPT